MESAVAWVVQALPSALWSIVGWVTFFFKLISLAFVVPIIGLIIFDFCVWLWRLYRPSLPDSTRTSRLHPDHAMGSSSAVGVDSSIESGAKERSSPIETQTENC
ncbi:hypothetical protein F5Y17DRAFT_91335 [Xylariaceae sp. FL0594]|nr:hypothetical protein F5Y17DRAFT_91335 [Xylariaceae sp. FL0594]